MKVIVNCADVKMEVPCGAGKQHMRWLALVVTTRLQREKYPHCFKVPQRITNHEGTALRPRQVISETLTDGEEVTVELRPGADIPEGDEEQREWLEEAYSIDSNLMECKIHWKVDPQDKGTENFPQLVRGDFIVAPRWQGIYPQKDYGGRFELPVEPDEQDADGNYRWIAKRKGPPGSCTYKFVMESGTESVCKADPGSLSRDGTHHYVEFTWDVPIAPEPYPEIDSRPSTASSRDGAQVDPRFEQDWEAMRLKWVESFMKVRVKDVLTEFYAILIDLFDSYAFMGLDLSASQHTIGMDDWKHLLINCGLLQGQPEGSLHWREVCTWFEEAAAVRDGRPYLAQRLTRAHYLELLMRTAGWTMCEHPRAQYKPEAGRPAMPLDEGLFRFITDILIPVMDVYDDDPIRKDAVQHQNLVVIQQNRPSIRSIYAFLAQPWPSLDEQGHEKAVVPGTLRWIFEYVHEKLEEAEQGGGAAAAAAAGEEKKEGAEGEAPAVGGPDFEEILGGPMRLNLEQIGLVLSLLDDAVGKVTQNHPEPVEDRVLLFWEFFEVVMECCRGLVSGVTATPLHDGIPMFVQTILGFMGLVDLGEVALPEPDLGGDDEYAEVAGD